MAQSNTIAELALCRLDKFNRVFDRYVVDIANQLKTLSTPNQSTTLTPNQSTTLTPNQSNFTNFMLDCECYKHSIIHAKISGYCNSKTLDNNFAELELHVLNLVDLDKIKNKVYPITFTETFGLLDHLTYSEKIIYNKPILIANEVELMTTMKPDYEGIVVYPLNGVYEFGLRRLYKIKSVIDGEGIVTGFRDV